PYQGGDGGVLSARPPRVPPSRAASRGGGLTTLAEPRPSGSGRRPLNPRSRQLFHPSPKRKKREDHRSVILSQLSSFDLPLSEASPQQRQRTKRQQRQRRRLRDGRRKHRGP